MTPAQLERKRQRDHEHYLRTKHRHPSRRAATMTPEQLAEKQRRDHEHYLLRKDAHPSRRAATMTLEQKRMRNRRATQRDARWRRARGHAADDQIEARIALYGGMCGWCGCEPHEEIDHVISLARGGTKWPANLRPACASCNLKKHTRDWSKRRPMFPG